MSICRNTMNGHLGAFMNHRLSVALPKIHEKFPDMPIIVVPSDDPELHAQNVIRIVYVRDKPDVNDGQIRAISFI